MTQGKKEILADLLQSARDELVKIDGSEPMSPTIRRAVQAELWLKRAAGLLENEVAPSRGLPKEESVLHAPDVDERLGATEDS